MLVSFLNRVRKVRQSFSQSPLEQVQLKNKFSKKTSSAKKQAQLKNALTISVSA
jgi:hypothetical protein